VPELTDDLSFESFPMLPPSIVDELEKVSKKYSFQSIFTSLKGSSFISKHNTEAVDVFIGHYHFP